MCRHCDRIVLDLEFKPVIHEFMKAAAFNLTKMKGVEIRADDIDCDISITNQAKIKEIRDRSPVMPTEGQERLNSAAHRICSEAFKDG